MLVFMLAACSVGVGEGTVTGVVNDEACGVVGPYDLQPNFFVAEAVEGRLAIRVQRGGDYDHNSDGIAIAISDAAELQARVGEPIALEGGRDDLVTMNFYANESCPLTREDLPINFLARSGTITFRSSYAPMVSDEKLIAAEFDDVRLVDPADPEVRFAVLSGSFEFFFNRGRPAQRFP